MHNIQVVSEKFHYVKLLNELVPWARVGCHGQTKLISIIQVFEGKFNKQVLWKTVEMMGWVVGG